MPILCPTAAAPSARILVIQEVRPDVVETEEQVSLDGIPAGARFAIEKYATGGKVLNVEVVTRDTVTSYEGQVRKAAKKSEVKVSPEGSILK